MMGTLGMADKINPVLHPAETNRSSLRVSDSIINLHTSQDHVEQRGTAKGRP